MKKTTFLFTWFFLMMLTVALLFVGVSSWPVFQKDALILVMMLIQGYLVSFYFMQLGREKFPMILSVVVGILVTSGILYFLILFDGSRIVRLMAHS